MQLRSCELDLNGIYITELGDNIGIDLKRFQAGIDNGICGVQSRLEGKLHWRVHTVVLPCHQDNSVT